jgi:hypothetical protein
MYKDRERGGEREREEAKKICHIFVNNSGVLDRSFSLR